MTAGVARLPTGTPAQLARAQRRAEADRLRPRFLAWIGTRSQAQVCRDHGWAPKTIARWTAGGELPPALTAAITAAVDGR